MFDEIQPHDMRLRRVSRVGDLMTVHFDAINDGRYSGVIMPELACIVEMVAPGSDSDAEVRAWPADNVREWAYYAVYVRIMELFWTGQLMLEGSWDQDRALRYRIPAVDHTR